MIRLHGSVQKVEKEKMMEGTNRKERQEYNGEWRKEVVKVEREGHEEGDYILHQK